MTVKYNFEIHTGDQSGAGTDSNIFVQLVGERGITNEVRLNRFISGNAFERNKTDKFSAEFNQDVGDIYKIMLRSDMLWGGPAWLVDYIKVRFVRSTKSKKYRAFSSFQIAKWIEDKKTQEFMFTGGYRSDVVDKGETYVEQQGKLIRLFNPTGNPMTKELHHVLETSIELTMQTRNLTSISAGASVKAQAGAIATTVDVSAKSEIERSSGVKWTQKRTFEATETMTLDPHQDTKAYEMWSTRQVTYDLSLGDTAMPGNLLKAERTYAGLKDANTGKWIMRTRAADLLDTEALETA